MRRLLLLPLASLGLLAAPPRVAVVHSAWPKGKATFAKEYEAPLLDLGWSSRSFRNTEQEALLAVLPQTDLVIAASVANYEDTVDFGLRRDAWLAFLRRGGILLVTDASYDSVLGKWVCGFGPEFALTTSTCVAHREKTPESRLCTYRDHPLLRVPNDLRPVLARRTNWAHLESWAPSWESLATCADGKSVMVCQRVGRGLVVVTSHFSFRSKSDHAAAKAILENLEAYRMQAASGVALTEVSVPPWAPGAGEAKLCLRNVALESRTVAATWAIAVGEHKTEVERQATVAPGATAALVLPRPELGRGRGGRAPARRGRAGRRGAGLAHGGRDSPGRGRPSCPSPSGRGVPRTWTHRCRSSPTQPTRAAPSPWPLGSTMLRRQSWRTRNPVIAGFGACRICPMASIPCACERCAASGRSVWAK